VRTAIRGTLKRLYELEVYDGDTRIAQMKRRIDELQEKVSMHRREYEVHQDELELLRSEITRREQELALKKKVEQTEAQRETALQSLLSDKRFLQYATGVREKRLHLSNPESVAKAIRTNFGIIIDESDLLELIGKATGEIA